MLIKRLQNIIISTSQSISQFIKPNEWIFKDSNGDYVVNIIVMGSLSPSTKFSSISHIISINLNELFTKGDINMRVSKNGTGYIGSNGDETSIRLSIDSSYTLKKTLIVLSNALKDYKYVIGFQSLDEKNTDKVLYLNNNNNNQKRIKSINLIS